MAIAIDIEDELKNALANDEFTVHYQPIFDLKTQDIVGMEALLRWEKGAKFIPPDQFIPIAEQTGLINPIFDWLVKTVCKQAVQWQKMDLPKIPISINLSPKQLNNPHLVVNILQDLKESHFDPKYLIIELTETHPIQFEHEFKLLKEFKASGLKLAIDDFGMGYSAFKYLKHSIFDIIKIDKSFIQDITNNENYILIKTMINMAKALGLEVVAEGVETIAQFKKLEELKCDKVQGYLFSRPIPVNAATNLLQSKVLELS